MQSDLQQVLNTPVEVTFFTREPGVYPEDFTDYTLLENLPEMQTVTFPYYHEQPDLLKQDIQPGGEIKVGSHLLRSKCKITHQPDWGSIYIHLKAGKLPAHASLLRYIVSLRDENHFHEEICEMIYKRLWDQFHPEILAVTCLYTRRGGIDICPSRANSVEYLPENLLDPELLSRKSWRQ